MSVLRSTALGKIPKLRRSAGIFRKEESDAIPKPAIEVAEGEMDPRIKEIYFMLTGKYIMWEHLGDGYLKSYYWNGDRVEFRIVNDPIYFFVDNDLEVPECISRDKK